MTNLLNVRGLVAICAMAAANPVVTAAIIDTVPVRNPGNAADGPYGSVAYRYRIGTYEVTNAQYAEFLNAKAASDPLQLYSTAMGSDPRGGISRTGVSGSFTYATRPNMDNKPVNFVTWFNAVRFANWLNNGQGAGDTESGAYTLLGGTLLPSNFATIVRNPGARWFLPSEDEWYKAAYHQPQTQGGDSDDYWLYPTATNTTPANATANSVGDISNPGANVVNYDFVADWNGQDGNVTTVGSAGPLSRSFYGTYDQGGNVWEWNERIADFQATPGFGRGLRGGSWHGGDFSLASHNETAGSNIVNPTVGFRVATVPEPGSLASAGFALILLTLVARLRSPRGSSAMAMGFIAAFAFYSAPAEAAPLYRVLDLGELPGGGESRAMDINDLAHVVGTARDIQAGGFKAFLWTMADGMQDLNVSPGYPGTNSANAINNVTEIVGNMEVITGGDPQNPNTAPHAFRWTSGGGVTDLAPGTSLGSFANGVNNNGLAVGVDFNFGTRAFTWDTGGAHVLNPLSGFASAAANDVNDNGEAVGWNASFVFWSTNDWRAVKWLSDGTPVPLGGLLGLGSQSNASAINSIGEIAGESVGRAVYWSSDLQIHDIGILAGHLRAYASDINNAGQIVGTSWISNFIGMERAFLWMPGGVMQDLNQLLDETGADWLLREATAINNHGQIVGYGDRQGYGTHAFLLTPIPEPATCALLLLGVALIKPVLRSRPVHHLKRPVP